MFLNPKMHELLVLLDRAKLETKDGEGWVAGRALRHIPKNVRNYAQQKGYMTGKGQTNLRQFKITAAGRTALANNAEANLKVMDKIENGFVPTGEAVPTNGAGMVKSLVNLPTPTVLDVIETAKQKNIQSAAMPSLPPYTEACVQAIDILNESFPEVGDLVDALMRINARKASSHE